MHRGVSRRRRCHRLRTKSDAALIAKVRESGPCSSANRQVRCDHPIGRAWTITDSTRRRNKRGSTIDKRSVIFHEHRRIDKRVTWPSPPDAEFPELKARLQALETHANSAIQVLSDFGVSGLMDPITTTWPARATSAVLDARLKPIETGATDALAILDLFGVENLPIFTVDETSTLETRISALETAGAAAQQKLQTFGIDI